MTQFGAYSRYYDLLYRDKDYHGEAEYIDGLIRRFCPSSRTVLNLGCGSGRHDRELAKLGYAVTGVDRSEDMLSEARAKNEGLEYICADLCQVRLNRRFDAVLALFHVFSYQATNADLSAAFTTASEHLSPGGVVLFDCWYGPAVLTDRPVSRVRELEDEHNIVMRHAEPLMYPNDNVVDVQYRINVQSKTDNSQNEISETHRMRYLFRPEVEVLLKEHGLKTVLFEEWRTGREPGFDTWNVVYAAIRA